MLKVNQLAVVASVIKSMVKALDDPIIIEDQKEEVSEWKHMTMKCPISCQMMKGLSHDAENLDGHNYVAEKLWDPGGLRASLISSGGECHGMGRHLGCHSPMSQWAIPGEQFVQNIKRTQGRRTEPSNRTETSGVGLIPLLSPP
jgi:hypothetical protein